MARFSCRRAAFAAALLAAVSFQAVQAKTVVIPNVPHVKQKPDFCGEACVDMWLKKLGHGGDQDWVYNVSGLDPRRDIAHARGCTTRELAAAMQRIGFKTGPVFHKVSVDSAAKELARLWAGIEADLAKGVPSIVCMHHSDQPKTTEHFRLVLGYDADRGEVIYHEPAESDAAYRRMGKAAFLKLWPLKYEKKRWTVIRLRLEGTRLRKPEKVEGHTAADYAQHVMALKRKVPAKGFHIVVTPPFVVVGDESAEWVGARSRRTVKWAVDHLRKAYFTKDPETIMDVWLFKDKASYRKYTKEILNDNPTTPFGYCSHQHNALIMNIATGGGTLVHEIVHPFIHSNFPKCPSWFDEGLASLYEQSGERDGRIVGFTNWRLAGLQEAVRAGRIPPFKSLCSTTRHQFYNMDKGANYAQARYLCYYLQQKGLLGKYYHAFQKDHAQDPTGYKTLLGVLGKKEAEMAAWQKDWEKWALGLQFKG